MLFSFFSLFTACTVLLHKLSRISGYLKHVERAGFSGILSPFVLHWILVVVSRIRLHNLLLSIRWLV